MYKIIKKIDQVESKPLFLDDTFIVNWQNRIDWQSIIKCYSVEENEIIWEISNAHAYAIYKDKIITGNLNIYNKKGNTIYVSSHLCKYNFCLINKLGISLWSTNESNEIKYHLFDANTKEFVCKNIVLNGVTLYIKDNYLVIRKPNAVLQIYDYTKSAVVWEKDFSEIAAYNDPLNDRPMKGEINKVYLYKEDMIIVSTNMNSTYCFELMTGKQVWESKSYSRTIEIVGEIGYVCTGLSLYKLNLETGERSNYYKETDGRMPNIIRGEDDVIWPAGNEVIFNGGLLWYSIYSSGYSYLIAINPFDGQYEWIHEVETNNKTVAPVFHKDRMYILDSGNNLHIYKK